MILYYIILYYVYTFVSDITKSVTYRISRLLPKAGALLFAIAAFLSLTDRRSGWR